MPTLQKILFFSINLLFWSCTIEHAQEQVVASHVNGVKKTSLWVYPSGEILKRNEWYNDGIKELEIPYKNNEPHGEFKRWSGFGDLIMVGEYKKGMRHGKWTSFYGGHFNKKKEAERFYRNDIAVGTWIGWHMNGNKAFEEQYSDSGDSIGVWKKWNEEGTLIEENSCHSKDSVGVISQYYPNGKRKSSTSCKFGILHGEQSEFTADKYNEPILTEHFDEGKLNGLRVHYVSQDNEGNLHSHYPYRQEHWKDGLRDSTWRWFNSPSSLVRDSRFENGTGIAYGQCENNLALVCAETSFVENVPGGILDKLNSIQNFSNKASLWYFKAGHELRYEEFWENGKIQVSRSFYPDTVKTNAGDSIYFSKMASEGFWKDGKRNGVWRNWYRSGILRDSLSYVNGERVGEQFSYDSTGKLTIHKTENGKNRPVIMHLMQ